MSAILEPEEQSEVDRFFAENQAWAHETATKWAIRPTGYQRHVERQQERKTARRNAASARRWAARLRRTPAWADLSAIDAIYAEARRLTVESGSPYHVDHILPLQGRSVSGLHVLENLRVLPGIDNLRKGNRFEVEA